MIFGNNKNCGILHITERIWLCLWHSAQIGSLRSPTSDTLETLPEICKSKTIRKNIQLEGRNYSYYLLTSPTTLESHL